MGQAKLGGSYEQRKEVAIKKEKERINEEKLYKINHPKPQTRRSIVLPLIEAMTNTYMMDYRKRPGD